MKILQAFSVSFLLLFASYAYADRPWPGSSPEGFRGENDLKTAIPDLAPIVLTYDAEGKALGFVVKNPDGIGAFRFGDKCFLGNGSPVKFLAPVISKGVNALDTQVYVEYVGSISLDPDVDPIISTFCPEHAVVAMSLKNYLAFERITTQATKEKKYLRDIITKQSRSFGLWMMK